MHISPRFVQFMEHYNSLPKTLSGVPYRHDLNPATFKDMISLCVIAVSRAPLHMEVTLCGSSVEKTLGLNITGINMFDSYPADEVDNYKNMFAMMFTQPCGIRVERIFTSSTVGDKLLTMIALPLANKQGVVDRLIALVSVQEEPSKKIMVELGDKEGLALKKTLSFQSFDIGYGVPESDFLKPVSQVVL